MKLASPSRIAGFGMRSASLGSRFVFVIVAAQHMRAIDFGIYGLVASASALIVQLAGLELYQITLRAVAKLQADSTDDRIHYGNFMALAALAAVVMGCAFAAWFGWSPLIIGLAGAICAFEYLGTEAQRICVVEGRADLAMVSVSLRYLPWNLGLPLLAIAGFLPAGWWSIDAVLVGWLVSSIIGCCVALPVAHRYIGRPTAQFIGWINTLGPAIPRWIAIAICYRFLESGIRLVPGLLINEQTAGRFVLLSMLASIGATGIKAAIEPFWFVRLIRPETSAAARREYTMVIVIWLALSAVVSTAALAHMQHSGRTHLAASDWFCFALMTGSASLLALSQIPHFALYATDQDKAIEVISIRVLVVAVVATFIGTYAFGLPGTALGALIGTGSLCLGKWFAVQRLSTGRQRLAPA